MRWSQGVAAADEEAAGALGEAVCYKCALHTLPDGNRGIFVQLPPSDDDQPAAVPYFFLPVLEAVDLPLRG